MLHHPAKNVLDNQNLKSSIRSRYLVFLSHTLLWPFLGAIALLNILCFNPDQSETTKHQPVSVFRN